MLHKSAFINRLINELCAQGLVTPDRNVKWPVPRLATRVPTFDDGSIQVLPDERMRPYTPFATT